MVMTTVLFVGGVLGLFIFWPAGAFLLFLAAMSMAFDFAGLLIEAIVDIVKKSKARKERKSKAAAPRQEPYLDKR